MVIDYSEIFENYNFINDFSFECEDYISDMLVKNYRTSIYNGDTTNKEDVSMLKKIDNIMKKYFIDSTFYKIIQNKLKDINDNYIQDLNIILISEYEKYESGIDGVITTSRWI